MLKKSLFSLILAAAALLAGCMSVPEGLDLSLSKPSTNHTYLVELRPLADPNRINQMHAWEAHVMTADGQPVPDARIQITGGMPQHHHGLPTQPAVIRELAGGRYVIGGVKFSMTGWWELKLKIDAARGSDSANFNLVIGQPVPAHAPSAPLGKV